MSHLEVDIGTAHAGQFSPQRGGHADQALRIGLPAQALDAGFGFVGFRVGPLTLPAQVQLRDQARQIARLESRVDGRGLWQAQSHFTQCVQVQLIGLQNPLCRTCSLGLGVVQRDIATWPEQAFVVDERQALCVGQKTFFVHLNAKAPRQALKRQGQTLITQSGLQAN